MEEKLLCSHCGALIEDWINVNKVDKKMRKKVHTKSISA